MAGTFNGSPKRRRIGILGGTFDPIHIGHLILAEEAWFQLRLDRIYLVPAGNPPHKHGRRMAPVEDRLCMAELATADVDYALVSRIDADRPGPALHVRHGAAAPAAGRPRHGHLLPDGHGQPAATCRPGTRRSGW